MFAQSPVEIVTAQRPAEVAPPIRNVVVIGGLSGRIGRGIVCQLAGRVRVFAHGRDETRVRQANRDGIPLYVGDQLVQLGGAGGRPVEFISDLHDVPHEQETLIITATTAGSVLGSLSAVPDGARLLTLENGWDTPARVKAANPSCVVSGGVAWFSCKSDPKRLGFDRVTPGGYIAIQPSSSSAGDQQRRAWGDDDMIRLVEQQAPEKRKTITNSMFNGLGIIFDLTVGQVLELRGYKALMRALAHEGRIAAGLAGADVGTEEELFAMAYAIGSRNAADHTSAYAMMDKGMRTEIDSMNGAIAREGELGGHRLPINAFINDAIETITRWRSEATSLAEVHETHRREIGSWRHHLLSLGVGFDDGHPAGALRPHN